MLINLILTRECSLLYIIGNVETVLRTIDLCKVLQSAARRQAYDANNGNNENLFHINISRYRLNTEDNKLFLQ